MKKFNLEEIMVAGGYCQTAAGRPVRIICTDRKGRIGRPIVALVQIDDIDDGETLMHYDEYGIGGEHDDDNLVPLTRRILQELWINFYSYGHGGTYGSRIQADENAGPNRLACVKVVIDCEVGEGLTAQEQQE